MYVEPTDGHVMYTSIGSHSAARALLSLLSKGPVRLDIIYVVDMDCKFAMHKFIHSLRSNFLGTDVHIRLEPGY